MKAININIISRPQNNIFESQIDKKRFPIENYNIQYNSTEDIVWDAVVYYEQVSKTYNIRCKRGGLMYFCGEPPLMHPLPYGFLKKFDKIIVPHPNVKHCGKIKSHGFLNWLFGYSYSQNKCIYNYEQIKNISPEKNKLISIITSNQKLMPGHHKRMEAIDRLKSEYSEYIDFFGRGICPVDSKSEAILPYMFNICIENTSIDDYWTEKFADANLGKCIPIYSGCTNINNYFDNKGFFQFDINDYNELKKIIEIILKDPKAVYRDMEQAMLSNREILMEKENIIPFIISLVKPFCNNTECQFVQLQPLGGTVYELLNLVIRIKRLIYRWYFKFLRK